MKKRVALGLTVLFVILAILPMEVAAHSGRTDSFGGHKDNKNKSGLGSYHYHCGGNPAHLHSGGSCPYTSGGQEEAAANTVSSVEIIYSSSEIKVGESTALSGSVYPSDAEHQKISWTSDNTAVASVDKDGKVSAVGAGTVVITAKTANGASGSFELTVSKIAAERIIVSRQSLELKVGDVEQLTSLIEPENVTDKTVTWSSSDEAVAGVDESGLVTAKNVGEVTITATGADGVAGLCKVTVAEIPAEKIEIEGSIPKNMELGEIYQISARVYPQNATDKEIKVTSDNDKILSVNKDGRLEAKAKGTAKISLMNGDIVICAPINVTPIMVKKLEVTTEPQRLEVGNALVLEALAYPDNAEDKAAVWTVDMEDCAKIKGNILTALKTGEITVTATINGISDSFSVEVYSNTARNVLIIVLILAVGGGGTFYLIYKRKKDKKSVD